MTRVIQVWAIWWTFPEAIVGDDSARMHALEGWRTASSGGVAFTALLLAWSIADAVRYTYLTCKMHHLESRLFTWIR
jgi:very-long-chain (3R)-3-hydroxyacyl-CoA dehydratase